MQMNDSEIVWNTAQKVPCIFNDLPLGTFFVWESQPMDLRYKVKSHHYVHIPGPCGHVEDVNESSRNINVRGTSSVIPVTVVINATKEPD